MEKVFNYILIYMSYGVNYFLIVEGNGFKNNDKDILLLCGYYNFDKKYIYIYILIIMLYVIFFFLVKCVYL